MNKTKIKIQDAFVELRKDNTVEKISVKELCQKAHISVSSFYTYYQDIYHLSNELEIQIVDHIYDKLTYINQIYDKPDIFVSNYMLALSSYENIIRILSSDHHSTIIDHLYIKIKQYLDTNYSEYTQDNTKTITLSYLIYGTYYAYLNTKDIKTIEKIIKKD